MIIGITAGFSAGKTLAEDYFSKKGFIPYSLSNYLRTEATKRNIEHSNENLRKLAETLEREQHGYLGMKAREFCKGNKDYVVTSIRRTSEVNELKKLSQFYLIAIDAPVELRFKWMTMRDSRPGDPKTLDEFVAMEEKQKATKETQIELCMAMANFDIDNDGTKEEFYQELERVYRSIKNK